MEELKIGGTYRHYKDKLYKVIGIAKHRDTLEDFVIYEALYDNEVSKLWVGTKTAFLEEVEVEGKMVPRFKLEV